MDFALTETQRELKDAARRYLADTYPTERIAELADTVGRDDAAWKELARQGWVDHDLGVVELALLAEECGRSLHPVPWWTTLALAAPMYAAAALEVPGPCAFANAPESVTAGDDGAGWRLDGRADEVVDAHGATEIVVVATTSAGPAVFAVALNDPYVHLHAAGDGIDPLRASASVVFEAAPARPLVDAATTPSVVASAGRRADALLSAEAVGVADRALEMACDYAKTRTQFGRAIGSYQAVAHQLAEAYADLELARSLAYRAACALDADAGRDAGVATDAGIATDADAATDAVATATQVCTAAATRVCETAIQVFGGIGVTWEFPLHRWYRRALWTESFHSGRTDPLVTIADGLFGPAPRA